MHGTFFCDFPGFPVLVGTLTHRAKLIRVFAGYKVIFFSLTDSNQNKRKIKSSPGMVPDFFLLTVIFNSCTAK